MYLRMHDFPPTPANTSLTDEAVYLMSSQEVNPGDRTRNALDVADNIAEILRSTVYLSEESALAFSEALGEQVPVSESYAHEAFKGRLQRGLLAEGVEV